MNDHNLDDLIIDTMEPSHSKTKSFLTIVALLIVFLIVGIILAKIYTGDTSNAKLPVEENNTELIAPELKLQTPKKEPKVREEPSLSSIIEDEIKAPVEKTPATVPTPTVETEEKISTPEPKTPTVVEKPVEIKKETVEITQEFSQEPTVETKPEVNTPKIVEKEIEVPKVLAVPTEKKVVKAAPKKPTVKKQPKSTQAGKYYIQVGSFSKTPSSRFLSVIKKSGFHYTIGRANAKGIKKLLIGPYSSRSSANAALPKVRDRINKKAFVVTK